MAGHDSYSTGPDIPAEALSGGTMNRNPNFETSKGDEPEAEGIQFGRQGAAKFVKPGKYPIRDRQVKDLGGKVKTIKGLTRVDH